MRVVSTKERLVKCYKLKKNFYVWEETLEDGSVQYSSCPFSAASSKETYPQCDGINEHGVPCFYAYHHRNTAY